MQSDASVAQARGCDQLAELEARKKQSVFRPRKMEDGLFRVSRLVKIT